jgi:putative flippase GtrA
MKQFGRYLLVGLVNTGISYGIIFACMYALRLSPVVSNALGYAIGVCVSYALNSSYTFNAKRAGAGTVVRFVMVCGVAYLANLGMLVLLIEALHVHAGVSQILAGGVYVVSAFLMNKHYVFRHRDREHQRARQA